MGEVNSFLANEVDLNIHIGKGKKTVSSSLPSLWDEVQGEKVRLCKEFTRDEIAAYVASDNPVPPEPYPWKSKSRDLPRIPRKKGEGRGVRTQG